MVRVNFFWWFCTLLSTAHKFRKFMICAPGWCLHIMEVVTISNISWFLIRFVRPNLQLYQTSIVYNDAAEVPIVYRKSNICVVTSICLTDCGFKGGSETENDYLMTTNECASQISPVCSRALSKYGKVSTFTCDDVELSAKFCQAHKSWFCV